MCETSQEHTVRYTVCISSTVDTHFLERIIGSVTVDTHIIKYTYITVFIFNIFGCLPYSPVENNIALGVYRTCIPLQVILCTVAYTVANSISHAITYWWSTGCTTDNCNVTVKYNLHVVTCTCTTSNQVSLIFSPISAWLNDSLKPSAHGIYRTIYYCYC